MEGRPLVESEWIEAARRGDASSRRTGLALRAFRETASGDAAPSPEVLLLADERRRALGGLRLVFGPASFSPLPTLVVGPGLGEPRSLSEARRQVTFTIRVPSLAELGQPDLVYVAEPPAGGAVTLLYGDRAGFPANAVTRIGLVITQFRADIGPDVFEKMIDSGVSVTVARVNGQAAWWVAGGEHYFFYRDANGRIVDETLRLAGNTLIWEEGGVTHRVEGAPTLAAATRLAESLR